MDINMIQNLISNFGFPIVMVGYFIWDKQKTMQPLIESINNMNTLLHVLIEKFDIRGVDEIEQK